jgi:hypothetical protein
MSLEQGSSSTVGNAAQAVLDQAGSLYREASAKAAPRLQSFLAACDAFVSSNTNTARLKFEGMESSVAGHLSIDGWIPDDAPNWVRGSVQVAAQATGTQAITLAERIPASKSLESNLKRLAGVR